MVVLVTMVSQWIGVKHQPAINPMLDLESTQVQNHRVKRLFS